MRSVVEDDEEDGLADEYAVCARCMVDDRNDDEEEDADGRNAEVGNMDAGN
jgi:hypothetical protein